METLKPTPSPTLLPLPAPIPMSPAPTPTLPCSAGVAVPESGANSGLVTDCAVLLKAMDTLASDNWLNWNAGAPIVEWEGIEAGGEPARVREVFLEGRGLTGLWELWLGGNELTGYAPPELWDVLDMTCTAENTLNKSVNCDLAT